MGVCYCSMFCCTLLYVHSSNAIILMGKRELTALLNLSSWCLVMVERLFLAMPRGCLQFVIVVFPDHTHLLFLSYLDSLYHSHPSESHFNNQHVRGLGEYTDFEKNCEDWTEQQTQNCPLSAYQAFPQSSPSCS